MIAIDASDLDLTSTALAADPWPTLRALRERGPVLWHETYRRWIVTTDRAVRKVLTNFTRFSVEGTTVEDLFGADAFISIDDRRRHDDLRNVWADAFRQMRLDALRPDVDGIAARLLAPVIDRLRAGEPIELTGALCRPMPTLVIARMMGVPDEALPDVVRWSDAMASGALTYVSDDEAKLARVARDDAKAALADYLTRMLGERRRAPGDDLVSLLATSQPGLALSDEALVQNLRQLLFAGNETTAKWLAHIFVTYGERPDVCRAIGRDRSLIGAANDEVMRWQPVVGTVVRRVRGGAIELAGVELADGDGITCLLGSANRDPARYDDPERFDIARPAKPSLGFGVGFHNCLGSTLAKLEADVLVGHVLDAVPEYAIAHPYAYSSVPLRGPLPVTITASA